MQTIRRYALGLFIVATLSLAVPTYAGSRDRSDDTLLARFRAFIVRVFDYNGVSLPPG